MLEIILTNEVYNQRQFKILIHWWTNLDDDVLSIVWL